MPVRHHRKVSKKRLLEIINSSQGFIGPIAQKAGISKRTLQNYLAEDKELENAVASKKEDNLDIAESKLMELVEEKSFPAIKFLLTTVGKKRGYTEKEAEKEDESKLTWVDVMRRIHAKRQEDASSNVTTYQ